MSRSMIIIAALSLSACGDRFPDYRYRMIVYVDTADGEKAFSSVRQVREREHFSIVDSNGKTVTSRLCGKALRLEKDGRTYFASLTKPDDIDYASVIAAAAIIPVIKAQFKAGNRSGPDYSGPRNIDEWSKQSQKIVKVEGSHPLPRYLPARQGRPARDLWPMFVTFDTPSNSATVREVSPEAIGVRRIEIAITDEPVTEGAINDLPWVEHHRGSLVKTGIDQPIGDLPAAQRLNTIAFRREDCEQ